MSECIFKWVKDGDVMIGVNTPGKISDEVWSAFMDDFGASDYKVYIGCTLGILEVSSTQRKQSANALRDNGVSVVVITNEVLVRGVVTAVSWLGAKVRSFSWDDFDRALEHTRMTDKRAMIKGHVDALKQQVQTLEHERRERRRAEMRHLG